MPLDPPLGAPHNQRAMVPEVTPSATAEATARVLVEALPYIQRFRGARLVIKYGGAAMTDENLEQAVYTDLVLMEHVGMRPIVVHGGGPEISRTAERMGLRAQFVDGQRVTDEDMLMVVEMVLSGTVNREIVTGIQRAGGRSAGVTGKDDRLITARKLQGAKDMGYVGEVQSVNPSILHILQERGIIPVVSPVGPDERGQPYNINADSVASAIATAMKADKLILLTDAPGVCRDLKDASTLIDRILAGEVEALIADGTISGGMIPKVRGAAAAIRDGVGAVHILDGRVPHALLLELFTDQGIGTLISEDESQQ